MIELSGGDTYYRRYSGSLAERNAIDLPGKSLPYVMEFTDEATGNISITNGVSWTDILNGREAAVVSRRGNRGGFRLMTVGNSLVANSYSPLYTSGRNTIKQTDVRGFMHYIRQQANFPWHEIHTSGLSGSTTEAVLARITDVISPTDRPDACWFILGGNEIIQSVDTQTISIPLLQGMMLAAYAAGIIPMVSIDWGPSGNTAAERAELDKFHWAMWLWCIKRGFPFLDVRCPMVRSQTAQTKSATYSRSGSTVTWTIAGHGYSIGDFVNILSATDIDLQTETQVDDTVPPDANTFTTIIGGANGATTGSGTIRLGHAVRGKTIDGLHTSISGASDIGDYLSGLFSTWPMTSSHPLGVEDWDYENMMGAGRLAAATQVSTGMLEGTGGTVAGTPAPTGSVAAGWELRMLTGSTGAAAVGSKGVLDAPLEHVPTQLVQLTSAATIGGNMHLSSQTQIPGAWTNGVKAVGDWALPTNGNNRLWLVCVTGGGTASTGPVCTESTTPPGTQIIDGAVVWEVRRGWVNGDTILVAGQARITAASLGGVAQSAGVLTDLCSTLSFGACQSNTGTLSDDLVDFEHSSNSDNALGSLAMRRRIGKTYRFVRQGIISGSPASLYVGWKFACKAGTNNSVTVEASRAVMINLTALGLT